MRKFNALVAARINAGFQTQKDLAFTSGISLSQVSNWERGDIHRMPRKETMDKLAFVCGLPLPDVIQMFTIFIFHGNCNCLHTK